MSASLPINRRYLALAVGVLLVAAAMRLIGAAGAPFWSDEAWNLWVIQTDFPTIITRLAANHHPPAYFLTLEAWRSIAGESKIALSFVAIAAGMLTCALVIRLGREGIGVFGALAAGLIFATFEQTVYYGQSIRHYSFLLLGAALTLWLFVRLLRRPTWPRAAAYGLAVAFTAYSLYIGAVLIAVQALIGLVVWRRSPRDLLKLAGAYGLALVVFTPWLVIGISGALSKIQRGAITGYINSIPSTPDGVLSMLDIVLGGQSALGVGLILVLIGLGWRIGRVRALFAAQFLVAFGLM
ncbi:MAG: glycosyltransferase family 39 protein, partial [Anaerolineae bacterium]|nr:glycosyltransferase family 39 protein [Anaerolineae bacterium]